MNWPPHNLDPYLPADHQGTEDPGNDPPEDLTPDSDEDQTPEE